ncbi:hypothetical protein IAD21_05695 [Abditibacteriota bacterium]|nr:hypothetical protein IAD21_05695 [Abditibacteriota bacterium]
MAIERVVEQELKIGEKMVVEAASKSKAFVVAFEDDGETGYFYACDKNAETYIVDAMHIYNVAQSKHMAPMGMDIFWSSDGMVAALFIARIAHGVFDFGEKKGWCRSNFPAPTGDWAQSGDHAWSDSALEMLV